jgi:two-component system chemotaxis sensor kinase CheA
VNPETCHLSFGMELESAASREDIEGAFSFVADDCQLDVQSRRRRPRKSWRGR